MEDSMRHADIDDKRMQRILKKLNVTEKDILLMTVDEEKRISYVLNHSTDGKIHEVDL